MTDESQKWKAIPSHTGPMTHDTLV